MKKITLENKEYIKFENIASGGGSDSIWVVLDNEKYNKALNCFLESAEDVEQSHLKIHKKIINNSINTKANQKINTLDFKKIFDSSIKKYIHNKKLNKLEKCIVKKITGEEYLQRIKAYKKVEHLYKEYGNKDQKIPIEKPKNDTAIFIIKNFNTEKLKKSNLKTRFENEIEFSKKVKNKYIIKYLESEYIENPKTNKPSLRALMPYYPKTLRNVINNRNDYTFETRLKMIMQLCKALNYIHGKNIWHRDIKPENIFVDNHNNIVLADFGIAHFPDSNITTNNDDFKNRAYAAPEQLKKNNNENINKHTDIYSLGLIINELFTGNVPRANDYEKIADYCPQYKWLDSLVSSMIKQRTSERISDIRTVIYEINIRKKETRTKQFYDKLSNLSNTYFFNDLYELSKKEQYSLKKMIARDLLIAKNIFETNSKEELEEYATNYHSIIGYNLSDALKNIIFQCLVYNECINKFKYESNSLNSYKSIDINSNELMQLNSILDAYKNEYVENLRRLTLKYFSSCCDYHCKEIIENIHNNIKNTIEDLNDSPILYLIIRIRELLNDDIYNQLIKDKNFLIERNFRPIKLDKNAYSLDDLFSTLSNSEKQKKDRIIDLLKNKYKAFIETSNNKMTISATFDSLKKYKKFFNDCFNNLKLNYPPGNSQYIAEGDLLDIKNKSEFGYQTYRISLNNYNVDFLISLFKLKDDN